MRATLVAIAISLASASGAIAQPAPQADPPEVEALYQKALDDFARGRFEDAAAGFDEVGIRSFDPARQTTSREMAKQARKRVGTTIAPETPATGIPPGTPGSPGTPGTPAVAPGIPATPPADRPENLTPRPRSRDSRYVLLVGTSLAGLAIYGPTMVVLSEDSSSKTQVGLYMLAAGTSFFAPYMLTRDEEVSWGMTDAWWHGMSRGALHGFFAVNLASTDPSGKEIATSVSLGSLIEGIGFTAYAWQSKVNAGITNSLSKGSDFGTGLAIAATAFVDPDGLDEQRASLSGLLGAAAGYAGGYYYGKLRAPTWGDGEVLRTTGIVGAYTAILPLILAEAETERTYLAFGMAGGIGGLVLGDYLLAGRDFTAGQGIVTELSTLAGGAAGAGLGYLIAPEDNGTTASKVIAVGAILGAAGGFGLTYFGLDTRVPAASSAAPPVSLQIVPDLAPDRRGLVLAGSF